MNKKLIQFCEENGLELLWTRDINNGYLTHYNFLCPTDKTITPELLKQNGLDYVNIHFWVDQSGLALVCENKCDTPLYDGMNFCPKCFGKTTKLPKYKIGFSSLNDENLIIRLNDFMKYFNIECDKHHDSLSFFGRFSVGTAKKMLQYCEEHGLYGYVKNGRTTCSHCNYYSHSYNLMESNFNCLTCGNPLSDETMFSYDNFIIDYENSVITNNE